MLDTTCARVGAPVHRCVTDSIMAKQEAQGFSSYPIHEIFEAPQVRNFANVLRVTVQYADTVSASNSKVVTISTQFCDYLNRSELSLSQLNYTTQLSVKRMLTLISRFDFFASKH